ncbi:MAG: response regulator [bacterium]|nr:response regulator [bacterium]
MSSAHPRILLVDDDPAIRDLVSRRLEESGFDCVTARDGNEALNLVQKRPFDLVLLDVMLPDINGLTILRNLREAEATANLPILMISANDESVQIVEAFNSGADDYITKPINFPVALARIRSRLRHFDEESAVSRSGEAEPPAESAKGAGYQVGESYDIVFLFIKLEMLARLATSQSEARLSTMIDSILQLFQETSLRYGGDQWSRGDDSCLFAFAGDQRESALLAAIEMQTLIDMYYMLEEITPGQLTLHAGMSRGSVVYREDPSTIYSEALNLSSHLARESRTRGGIRISATLAAELGERAGWYLRDARPASEYFEYRFPA